MTVKKVKKRQSKKAKAWHDGVQIPNVKKRERSKGPFDIDSDVHEEVDALQGILERAAFLLMQRGIKIVGFDVRKIGDDYGC